MLSKRLIEFFLIQTVLYLVLWVINEYMASLLSAIFICIFIAILVVSIIVELIEPSKVPKWYYKLMILSILAPLLAGGVYIGIMGGELAWTKM